MNIYENLKKLYPIQKTVRFELKPQGRTLEYIRENNILNSDEDKSIAYKKVKLFCDEYHKKFIEESLQKVQLENLDKYYELYKIENRDEKQSKEFNDVKKALHEEIVKCFVNNKEYKDLFGENMIKANLVELYKENENQLAEIEKFTKFTTYFTGFNKNRENIYSKEEKSTSIVYRIINENLPVYINNMKIYQGIKEILKDKIEKIDIELLDGIGIQYIERLFELQGFNKAISQKQIEKYNLLIIGKRKEDNTKIKGLNEYINEYNQINKTKIPRLKTLYKQILSDKETESFVYDVIENDVELIEMINNIYVIMKNCIFEGEKSLVNTMSNLENLDLSKIYINNDLNLTKISNEIFGNWSYIQNELNKYYEICINVKDKVGTQKYEDNMKKYFKNTKLFDIEFLDNILGQDSIKIYLEEYIVKNEIKQKLENVYTEYEKVCVAVEQSKEVRMLIKKEEYIEIIKNLLDVLINIERFVKSLILKEDILGREDNFYNNILEIHENIRTIDGIYNKVRNYLTQKPFSNSKINLTFEVPTLLDGWDLSKESSNLAIMFMKENKYYLGIINKQSKEKFNNEMFRKKNFAKEIKENDYRKMEYKLLPSPNKMLPKVFFAKKNSEKYKISPELKAKYDKGMHKVGDTFDLNACHELIDFFKESIEKNEDWVRFGFEFSNTKTYKDISGFYREVEQQGYNIKFENFSEEYINELVENGQLYLFQIYSKDFSEYSKGKPNLHTLYFKALFNEENIKKPVYKLNGEAQIFYRKASLPRIEEMERATHPKNMPVANKNIETIKNKPNSIFEYDLIKDKRYREDKFLLHIPITMNFGVAENKNINEIVNKNIKATQDINVIGIDRGERNLLYICVINSKGEIIYQESLNTIENEYSKTDYHQLLTKKGDEREKARESWKTIENIKELKEGYLSQVVHKIVKLMKKYNAIIVLEDLNNGFKNSRIKFEKQVYQKFEKMLIEKLNYLIYKDDLDSENGGLFNAYQLTNEFETFQKMGKQSGVLLYIPAWCTSKIDPTTGFVNLLSIKYESINKAQEFFAQFDDIKFNEKAGYYEFYMDYMKFTKKPYGVIKDWVICTYSSRVITYRDAENNSMWTSKEIQLTEEYKKLFNEFGIDNNNIKEKILKIEDKNFFERLLFLFKTTMQMRNSITGTMVDYIVSPVKNINGEFFDSRNKVEGLPEDADCNGAYNIAQKGNMIIEEIRRTPDDKLKNIKPKIKNEDWLTYVQNSKWKK